RSPPAVEPRAQDHTVRHAQYFRSDLSRRPHRRDVSASWPNQNRSQARPAAAAHRRLSRDAGIHEMDAHGPRGVAIMSDAAPTIQNRLRDEILPPLIILALALGFWELSVKILDIPPWLLPAPSDVVDRFFKTATLWYHTGLTVLEALAGFAVSAVLGVSLSAGIGHAAFALPRTRRLPLCHRIQRAPNHRHHSAAHHLVRFRYRAEDNDLFDHLILPDRHQHDARAQSYRSPHHRIHAVD